MNLLFVVVHVRKLSERSGGAMAVTAAAAAGQGEGGEVGLGCGAQRHA